MRTPLRRAASQIGTRADFERWTLSQGRCHSQKQIPRTRFLRLDAGLGNAYFSRVNEQPIEPSARPAVKMSEEEAIALLRPRQAPLVAWLNGPEAQALLKAKRKVRSQKASKRVCQRLKVDTDFRIMFNLRNRIHAAFRAVSARKRSRTLYMLGCSIQQLKAYMQTLWLPGMSWDNYGEWHIDHKIPCAAFDLSISTHQNICFHWSNLQPLWARDNYSKGARCKPLPRMSRSELIELERTQRALLIPNAIELR